MRDEKNVEKKVVKPLGSAGDADPGQGGFWEDIPGRQARSSTPSLILRMGGRIEPAEPEPPPAHSIGRVGQDAMGRSGQFVKPCWLLLVVWRWW